MSTEASTHCVVQTALPSEAQAAELARAIVQARLGACVQLQIAVSASKAKKTRT